MSINLKVPGLRELKPRIMVCGVGGAGGNAVNNMIVSGLVGVDFIVANTDAQALTSSRAERIIQMGLQVTEGLGAGSQPEVGRAAAEEAIEEIRDHLAGAHMCFVTAGMGGGTGTGAAPVIARTARDMGILTVGVVTKPFQFEGQRRMRVAEAGINELQKAVDTLIVIPNQNLFRVANEKTTFADAFSMADQVLYSGVACITDLMVKEGLINLDFADVRAIMREMGKAMMGTGEATGDKRAIMAAEAAIANPLLDEVSMKGARGLLISITGGNDLTLYEVDEAASRIRQEVDDEANIILGATFEPSLDGLVRVSVVATGIDQPLAGKDGNLTEARIAEVASRLRAQTSRHAELPAPSAPVHQMEPVAYQEPAPMPAQAPAPQQHYALSAPPQHYAPPHMPADVEIHAVPPKPVHYAPAAPAPTRVEHMESGPFVPPMPTMPQRGPRMPQVEDLPLPVQNQIRSHRGELQADQSPAESKRRTLLERLASFGMSRQDEVAGKAIPATGRPTAPAQLGAPTYGNHQAPPAQAHADYAKRPQQAPVARHVAPDQHGRPAPATRHVDDDQLEIPAFLRRQSN
ncbi:cell division protein FtsZ [Lichenihabitans sp. Uapishka_5]|uniref:cell division protein FtsZ n=1 Tax=Lichenihabitans sp. Uapishka_5 TaxID=3037302 RepID=UPI0029E7F28E|nr:cell division protein FtsZ [Lichenihabitans sp. Uapishka_5]MDX7952253.1 cell division protein FtsZ [Lichenihabitans sp. Uapishka_5]